MNPKPIRFSPQDIKMINEKGKGNSFSDKVRNGLYIAYRDEDQIMARIERLKKEEQNLRVTIQGLMDNKRAISKILTTISQLLIGIVNKNTTSIDSSKEDLSILIDSIKESLI